MQVAVTIIAYSNSPTELELKSFDQCLRVLGRHPLILVCPDSLNIQIYEDIAERQRISLRVERFADNWFTSVQQYNLLLLSTDFYKRFCDIGYILIYQLDAWVFSDQLLEWCDKGYYYIGAPWFNGQGELLPIAGNGGFCLRSPSACLRLLSGELVKMWNFTFMFLRFPTLRSSYHHFQDMLHFWWNPHEYIKAWPQNEDVFFSKALEFTAHGKVAPPSEAMFFSFECFPEKLYSLTGQKLPFGCHAIARYNPTFWKNWIPALQTTTSD